MMAVTAASVPRRLFNDRYNIRYNGISGPKLGQTLSKIPVSESSTRPTDQQVIGNLTG
jgi:hypothetical protein